MAITSTLQGVSSTGRVKTSPQPLAKGFPAGNFVSFTHKHKSHNTSSSTHLTQVMKSYRVLFGLAVLFFSNCVCAGTSLDEVYQANVRNSGLYKTAWPIDHADSARNKFGINTGFDFPHDSSKMVSPDKFNVETVQGVDLPQWYVTRNSDEIYLMAGTRLYGPTVAKVNTTTMEVVQSTTLNRTLYIGGLAVLDNGHVYCVIGNRLYRFWQGNLDNITVLDLPGIEGGLEQTNGMIVTSNSKIIVKTWAWTLQDFGFFYESTALDSVVLQITVACGVIGMIANSGIIGALFGRNTTNGKAKNGKPAPRRRAFRMVLQGFRGFVLASAVSFAIAVALIACTVYYMDGEYSPYELVFGKWRDHFSRVSVVDPDTMEVLHCANLTFDRLSIARMSLVADSKEHGVDNLVTLGDEFAIRWRYYHANHTLVLDEDWTERYRHPSDGSYPGTGPSIINDIAYFTDNTFPIYLGPGYRMYKKPLHPTHTSKSEGKLKRHYEPMQQINVNKPGEPGFMFWSPVFVPNPKSEQGGCVLVWDTVGRSVQCRSLDNLNLVWEVQANNSDCVSSSIRVTAEGSKTLVYFSDYDQAPLTAAKWMRVTGADRSVYKNTTKYLVVVDGTNGKVQARIPVVTGDSVIYPSMIVPGPNNEVFMAGRGSFLRVKQK